MTGWRVKSPRQSGSVAISVPRPGKPLGSRKFVTGINIPTLGSRKFATGIKPLESNSKDSGIIDIQIKHPNQNTGIMFSQQIFSTCQKVNFGLIYIRPSRKPKKRGQKSSRNLDPHPRNWDARNQMLDNKFVRCEPDDPSRCQAVGKGGQCPFRALGTRRTGDSPWDGQRYCPRHGPNRLAENPVSRRLYLAALWKDQIGEQADHPKVKSLREEMGILRMTLNTRLEMMKSSVDLMMHAGQVIELVREIGKLAKTAHHIEKDMGQLLDKTQAESWVQELLTIISNYINDPEILTALSEDMVNSLERRTCSTE